MSYPPMVGDRGASNERTTLAWQRTALSLAVGSVLLMRLTFHDLGIGALVGAGLALGLSGWVLLESRWRYLRTAGLRGREARGGRAAACLAVATVVLSVTEIAALVSGPGTS